MICEKPFTGNICIGLGAGKSLTTGSRNVCLGTNAGADLTTENNQFCIVTGEGKELRADLSDEDATVLTGLLKRIIQDALCGLK